MICDRYELRDDVSPGAGKFHGGMGVVKAQRVLTDGYITHECERHEDAPWGIFGGQDGVVGKVEIYNVNNDDEPKQVPAKFSGLRVRDNDVMAFYAPCGGGYGDPLERDPALVLDDVLDDYYSAEEARKIYGVVVNLDTETIDDAATADTRAQMMQAAAE